LGTGLAGFMPPDRSNARASVFMAASTGDTFTGGGGVTVTAGTTAAVTNGVLTDGVDSAAFDDGAVGVVGADMLGAEGCGIGAAGWFAPVKLGANVEVPDVDTAAAGCLVGVLVVPAGAVGDPGGSAGMTLELLPVGTGRAGAGPAVMLKAVAGEPVCKPGKGTPGNKTPGTVAPAGDDLPGTPPPPVRIPMPGSPVPVAGTTGTIGVLAAVELPEPEPVVSVLVLPPEPAPGCDVSAWASADPLASAAPTPSVTAPAPSQVDASVWRWWARRLAFFISALAFARLVVRCMPAIAVPNTFPFPTPRQGG
jgi:hypothetical protein